MAARDRIINPGRYESAKQLSRLSGKQRLVVHSQSITDTPFGLYKLPTDSVEVMFQGKVNNRRSLIARLFDTTILTPSRWSKYPFQSDRNPNTMLVYVGPYPGYGANYSHEKIIDLIQKRVVTLHKTILFLGEERDPASLNEKIQERSIFDYKGYLDWGINHTIPGNYNISIMRATDVACFWDTDHAVGTLLIPDTATMGGILKAQTVMKRPDVMITSSPPYEVVKDYEHKLTKAQIDRCKMVSAARKIWNPDTHYYGNRYRDTPTFHMVDGKSVASKPGSRQGEVVRWTKEDVRNGPPESAWGYPLSMDYYLPYPEPKEKKRKRKTKAKK